MAEKLTIKKWFDEEDGLPERYAGDGTYLGTYDQGYDICEDGTQVGCANYLDVALLFAASPMLHSALTRLLEIIERNDNVTHNIEYADSTILDQARAALEAAEGEWSNEINVQSTEFESSGVLSVSDELVLPKRGE